MSARKNPAAVSLGRRGGKVGGKSTSEAKGAAARANGTKGGRPRAPFAAGSSFITAWRYSPESEWISVGTYDTYDDAYRALPRSSGGKFRIVVRSPGSTPRIIIVPRGQATSL